MSSPSRFGARTALAVVAALSLAVLVAPAGASAVLAPGCKVTNARTHVTRAVLPLAVLTAVPGDTLRIRGICKGGTRIDRSLHLVGVRTKATGIPTLDGRHAYRILEIEPGVQVTVAGLTLRNGRAWQPTYPANAGAAILLAGSLTLTNADVYGNMAELLGGGGGAIEVMDTGALVVGGDTRIHDNRAAYGAVEVFGTAVFKERTRIDHNTATREGGGLFVGDDGSHSGNVTLKGHARIDDNTVTPAVGKGQGGGVYLGDASLTLTGSARIDHNTAAADGGGIFLLHPLAASVLTGAICGLNVRKNTPDQIGPSCPKVITP